MFTNLTRKVSYYNIQFQEAQVLKVAASCHSDERKIGVFLNCRVEKHYLVSKTGIFGTFSHQYSVRIYLWLDGLHKEPAFVKPCY